MYAEERDTVAWELLAWVHGLTVPVNSLLGLG